MTETVPHTIETLFRRESGRLISVLTRLLGPQNLELAEDVVQEAFVAAMKDWRRTAFRTTRRRGCSPPRGGARSTPSGASERAARSPPTWRSSWTASGRSQRLSTRRSARHCIKDDQLRMIFMCCHPTLAAGQPPHADSEDPVRLERAGHCARAAHDRGDDQQAALPHAQARCGASSSRFPPRQICPDARETVHTALYLLFNEGYLSTADKPILRELCRDAMLLTRLLADDAGDRDERHARAPRAHVLQRRAARVASRRGGAAGAARPAGSVALGRGR